MLKKTAFLPAMNSANRVYDDGDYEETGGENLDGIAGDDEAAAEDGGAPVKTLQNLPEGMQAVQMKPGRCRKSAGCR